MPKLKSYQIYFEGGECRSSHPDAYLGIGVLKICSKCTGEKFTCVFSCKFAANVQNTFSWQRIHVGMDEMNKAFKNLLMLL